MKKLNMIKQKTPKIAVCITMYNENEAELQMTMRGVLQNYNAMYLDKDIKMRKPDMIVVCVCDGFEKIPESFRKYATKKQFLDVDILLQKGFMTQDRDGQLKMKTMDEVVAKNVKRVPKNIVHLFQVCTWDFGVDDETLQGRRINFIFALKQRNDGKINSHKWFF
jgi:cellulose synthase/poly-beta-1,6-N-acetylglucosamine synthase-like glycosyltransferase